MLVSDFHNDLFTAKYINITEEVQRINSVCDKSVCAVFRGNRKYKDIKRIAESVNAQNGNKIILALEDIGYANEKNIDEIIALKPLYVSLCWNKRNALASGCKDVGGLTKKSKAIIKKVIDAGIAIDTAHLNEKSFYDVLDSGADIINSHTCVYSLNENKRNIKDGQIKSIIERNGLIGIAFVGRFLTDAWYCDSYDVVKHIDYIVQKYGCDNVCFGSDFFGTIDLPKDLYNFNCMDNLVEKLSKIGYNRETVEKIAAKNINHYINGRNTYDRYERIQ